MREDGDSARAYSRCSIDAPSRPPCGHPEEETGPERYGDLPEVTQH